MLHLASAEEASERESYDNRTNSASLHIRVYGAIRANQSHPRGERQVCSTEVAMPSRTIVWDREKLYDLIWTKPIRTVAHEYGLSDVA